MRRRERENAERLYDGLAAYERRVEALPGIAEPRRRDSFVEQLVESDRRSRYIRYLARADLSPSRLDPSTGKFDPLKAAVLQHRAGNLDDALWMIFLFIHFGRHRSGRWQYASAIYGRLGDGMRWDWSTVSGNVDGFRDWMSAHETEIRARGGGFGNHRKYESLAGWSEVGTGAVVSSFVEWARQAGGLAASIDEGVTAGRGDPQHAFDVLYRSMSSICRFGRTARFDYLSTVEKLDLAPIRPGGPYLVGATGPLRGARMMFDPASRLSTHQLEQRTIALQPCLDLGFDALEDALCNWQKSPDLFKPFRG